MVKGGAPQWKDSGAKSKPQTAAKVQWAAAAGQIVAVPSDKGSECALLARFGRPSGGAALQAVDVQQVCGGGASGEKGVVLCVAHVCDISIGLGIFVALVCSPGEDTCSYSLYRINDKPSTKSAAPLVTFTVSGSGPGNLFEQGYSSSWVTDGPVVCVPKENGLAVAQLAHRGGNMGFCWSVHVVRVTGSPCRLLTVGCFQSDISLPFALLTTKQNDTWTWVTAPLSNPNPQHASPPFLPHSVANVTICALILPRSAHAFALGTHSSEIVLVNQGGMIALTICLSIAPRFLCLADTCSSIGPVLAVRSLDSPPALQLVPLRSRTPFSCKTASLASLASEVFPVALSGPAHDAIVVPCQADTPSESFEGCVCISLKEVLLTDEGQAKEASGLVKVAKALELKSLGCIQELQKLQEQLSQKRHLREHTHSLLLRAVLPKISHTHSPGSSTLNQKAPLMIQLGGHAAPPSPARELLNVPMVYNVQHHYNGGRLYVSATANNPYQRPLKNVALCLVANGMQCESRGGRPSAIPSEESLDISGCARVIEGDGHLARGGWWAFECLLRWELDGEVCVSVDTSFLIRRSCWWILLLSEMT